MMRSVSQMILRGTHGQAPSMSSRYGVGSCPGELSYKGIVRTDTKYDVMKLWVA